MAEVVVIPRLPNTPRSFKAMTARQYEALRDLVIACQEAWVWLRPQDFGGETQFLNSLVQRGFVERRHPEGYKAHWEYRPTEIGMAFAYNLQGLSVRFCPVGKVKG